jgi:heme/copper-type cytochrome/quinol oxidase subunit 2
MNILSLLAQKKDPFGRVEGFGPASGAESPQAAFSSLLSAGITIFFIVGGLAALVFMLWGAFDYIASGGEQEKIQQAQAKMMYAAIGAILIIVVLAGWTVITGDILGIIKKDASNNWVFELPRVGCIANGAECDPDLANQCCSGNCEDDGTGIGICQPN